MNGSTPLGLDTWSRLRAAPLWRGGGYRRLRLLDEAGLSALRAEAFACHRGATEVAAAAPEVDDQVRGNPARWLESAPGGPLLQGLLHAPTLLRLLGDLTDLDWIPSGDQGTYSYYRQAGHHLELHRDVDICDLAVITCLHDSGAPPTGEGTLIAYPDRWWEPLARIRATPREGAVPIPLAPGGSVVLIGGAVPHRLPPIGPGRVRIVAPLCFRVAADRSGALRPSPRTEAAA